MKNPRVSILSIGSELLDGRVLDTNSNYLANLLSAKGFAVIRSMNCDDTIDDICKCLEFLASASDIIIISGGLGPTTDDLTREALAKFLKVENEINPDAEAAVREYCEKKQRPFAANIRQTFLPQGAKIIQNSLGSAPGILIEYGENQLIACFPGVPSELKTMCEQNFLPSALEKYPQTKALTELYFCIFGLPEAVLGKKVENIAPDPKIKISYRPAFPFIHLLLKAEENLLSEINQPLINAIGHEYIISRNKSIGIELVLHNILLKKKLLISVAESCTGGQIGQILTNTPGSSTYFLGSAVTYCNEAKKELLAVLESSLESYGAVSHQIAKEMAAGTKARYCSDISISVTGIAGPDGGSEEKPVGTFYVGYASDTVCSSYKFRFIGSRDYVRTYAAYAALDVLRRKLLELPIPAEEISK